MRGAEQSLSLFLALLFLLVLMFVSACPVVALLKQKYVLFAAGLLLVAVGFPLGPGTLGGGSVVAVGLIVWITAAVRLAPPAARWARQLYGPEKLARAHERPAGLATRAVAEQFHAGERGTAQRDDPIPGPIPGPVPERPPRTTVAVAAIALGFAVLSFLALFPVLGVTVESLVIGVALPLLWMIRAGWRRGRTIVTVLAVVVAAIAGYEIAVNGHPTAVGWVVVGIGVLLLAAGLVTLYRDPVDGYLQAATR